MQAGREPGLAIGYHSPEFSYQQISIVDRPIAIDARCIHFDRTTAGHGAQLTKSHGIRALPTTVISAMANRFRKIPARLICGTER